MRLDTRLIDHDGQPLRPIINQIAAGSIFDITTITGSPLADASGNDRTLSVLKGSYTEATSGVQKWGKGILCQDANILGISSPPAALRITGNLSIVARVNCNFTTEGANGFSHALACGLDVSAGLSSYRAWYYALYTHLVSGTRRWGYAHSGNPNTGLSQRSVLLESTAAATPGEHTITLRRDVAARTVVMKVDGVVVINGSWSNSADDPFVESGYITNPFTIGGYDSTLVANAVNRRWGGAVFSAHIFPSLIDQAVLDAMAVDIGTDHAIGGEVGFWPFTSSSQHIGGLYEISTTTDSNGDFSVDVSALGFVTIHHVTPIAVLDHATHTNLVHAHLRSASTSAIAGTVTTVAGSRAGAGVPVKILVVGRRT